MRAEFLTALALALSCALWLTPVRAGQWHGTLRTKAQIDNRYGREARAFGELWGEAVYDDRAHDWRGAVDIVGRGGVDGVSSGQRVYQAFIDKGFAALDARVKIGRFERTDNMGFYRVDGAAVTYSPKGQDWAVEVYGGRPGRIDHLLSVEGKSVAGVEGRTRFSPTWVPEGGWLRLDAVELRGGYQQFDNGITESVPAPRKTPDEDAPFDPAAFLAGTGLPYALSPAEAARARSMTVGSQRVHIAGRLSGRARENRKGAWEMGWLGTYRLDNQSMQDVLFNGQLDWNERVRVRGSWEYYRPRGPFLSFREKFFSAYALGGQTLARLRAHHTPLEGFTWFAGGMRAGRDGTDGFGADVGASWALTPRLTLSGELDFLSLGEERAESAYASLNYLATSRLQLKLGTALRHEEKWLYGANDAKGAEGEVRYMLRNDLVLNLAGSIIWNSRLPEEYLGAVQFIYYFDPFQPKAM